MGARVEAMGRQEGWQKSCSAMYKACVIRFVGLE
jgi:hypothetical protein